LEDGGVDRWRWDEGASGQRQAARGLETPQLSTVLVDGSPHDGPLQNEVRSDQVGGLADKSQHCSGERVWLAQTIRSAQS
jgi:hypothetical protein